MIDPRTTKILNHLRSEGYAANLEDDGDIRFKYNRLSMTAGIDLNDKDYYRVNLFSVVERHQVAAARRGCENATYNLKIVKATAHDLPKGCAVLVSVECLHPSVEDFLRYLERYLSAIMAAVEKIASTL